MIAIMGRRRTRVRVLLVLVVVVAGLGYFVWPRQSTFTVGPATTYVTGPLDPQGYPDYVTALNARLSRGIKPRDNANALIWQGSRPDAGRRHVDAGRILPVAGDRAAAQEGRLLR
jgi:hypothetical protein